VNGVTTVSIVIPTLNRSGSLRKLLLSILYQTSLPEEVIVVDDSDYDKTSKLVKENSHFFLSNGISLKYSRGNSKNRCMTAARNIGAAKSTGEIVLFLDDDVMLDNKYVEEVLKTYEEYPMAKGVQGYIVNEAMRLSNFRSILVNSLNRIFFMGVNIEKNKCFYRLGLTYPYSPDRIIQCNWLYGANMSFKREVFQCFRFDENLGRRSIGEDLDFSYRVYKRYPNSLLMNSKARLIHNSTLRISESLVYLDTTYFVYLFFKNYEQTIRNRVLLLWSLLGRLILGRGLYLIVSRDAKPFFWSIKSHICILNHFSNVKNGDFRFLDSILD
jgi:glycosyltransferase involved in cell wall biosynthesis